MPSTPSAEAARAPSPARTDPSPRGATDRPLHESIKVFAVHCPSSKRSQNRSQERARLGLGALHPRCHTFLLAGSPKTMSIIATSVVCRCLVPLVSARPHPAPRRAASPRAADAFRTQFGHISGTFPRRGRVRASRNTNAALMRQTARARGRRLECPAPRRTHAGDDAEIVGDVCQGFVATRRASRSRQGAEQVERRRAGQGR